MNYDDAADLFRHVTADKATLYRAVMNVFAAAKRQYRLQLRPDEVLAEAIWEGAPPTREELGLALAALTEWGNLESQPDMARVATLSDYYRARFLYRLSHGGEAVEAGLAVFEQTLRHRAELQTVALEDIDSRLQALCRLLGEETVDVAKAHEILRDLVRVFEDLTANAQAFMAGVARSLELQQGLAQALESHPIPAVDRFRKWIHNCVSIQYYSKNEKCRDASAGREGSPSGVHGDLSPANDQTIAKIRRDCKMKQTVLPSPFLVGAPSLLSSTLAAAPWTEQTLMAAAIALGAEGVAGWSPEEKKLAKGTVALPPKVVASLRDQIRAGHDPLGDLFGTIRTPVVRRDLGATYTPPGIVNAMLTWAKEQDVPDRIVDPGVGSGRFLLEAGRRFSKANLVGVELDPLATAIARGNLAAAGYANRSRIVFGDYRDASLRSRDKTLFIGNPPYVRHHLIDPTWKAWLVEKAAEFKLEASQLAGLHVYFFLATALNAKTGDFGALITAAEWLDVNYGKIVRDLFLGKLGGQGIVVIEPTAAPFPDAASTAAITFFKIKSKPASVRLRRVKRLKDLNDLSGGRAIRRERLEAERRWSRLTYGARPCPEGFVELGELCRVHRGQVTGANRVWIAGEHTEGLPERVLFPTVTKARELISAGKILGDHAHLRSVVDLPEDLDEFAGDDKTAIDRFLKLAKQSGVDSGYVASHRRAWWSVGLRNPAPILATYMARRAPAFARNLASARHINIAHGLYPREALSENQLLALVDHLSTSISVVDGRTYAGGLTKFEPGEMERLFVPRPELLVPQSHRQQ